MVSGQPLEALAGLVETMIEEETEAQRAIRLMGFNSCDEFSDALVAGNLYGYQRQYQNQKKIYALTIHRPWSDDRLRRKTDRE